MKKYLLISEVAEILGLTQTSLRYIEKSNNKIKISKIRGRRYYKVSDIEKIAREVGVNYIPLRNQFLETFSNNISESQTKIEKSLPTTPVCTEVMVITEPKPLQKQEEIVQLDLFSAIPVSKKIKEPMLSTNPVIVVSKVTYEDLHKAKLRLLSCKERLVSILN